MPYYRDFKDISSDPEYFGLEHVTEFELREPDYSFDTFSLWYHPDECKYYWAEDSGCSCPSPFEDFGCPVTGDETLDDAEVQEVLDKMGSGDFLDALSAIGSTSWDHDSEYVKDEVRSALESLVNYEQRDS